MRKTHNLMGKAEPHQNRCAEKSTRYYKSFYRTMPTDSHLPFAIIPLLIVLTLLVDPSPALALQAHGAPEGLYVHQMAHTLFMAAVLYLFWDIRRSSFHGRGWDYLQLFCLVVFLWNLASFTGHFTHFMIQESDFHIGSSYLQRALNGPLTHPKLTFYLTRLDNLILVPALFFLYLALRAFYRAALLSREDRS